MNTLNSSERAYKTEWLGCAVKTETDWADAILITV